MKNGPVEKYASNNRLFQKLIVCFLAFSMFLLTGCKHTESPVLATPITEDFVSPPNEPRYTQPPESAYRNPPAKKAWGAPPPGGGGPMQ